MNKIIFVAFVLLSIGCQRYGMAPNPLGNSSTRATTEDLAPEHKRPQHEDEQNVGGGNSLRGLFFETKAFCAKVVRNVNLDSPAMDPFVRRFLLEHQEDLANDIKGPSESPHRWDSSEALKHDQENGRSSHLLAHSIPCARTRYGARGAVIDFWSKSCRPEHLRTKQARCRLLIHEHVHHFQSKSRRNTFLKEEFADRVQFEITKKFLAGDPTFQPVSRSFFHINWTGRHFVYWGGVKNSRSGAIFDPKTESWQRLPIANTPTFSLGASQVWTGNHWLFFGGTPDEMSYWNLWASKTFMFGKIFQILPRFPNYHSASSPATRLSLSPAIEWERLASSESRIGHSAVWTGNEMLVWGGREFKRNKVNRYYHPEINTGTVFDPNKNQWTPLPQLGWVPSSRSGHIAHWTGNSMLIWGGQRGTHPHHRVALSFPDGRHAKFQSLNDGAIYLPKEGRWTPIAPFEGIKPRTLWIEPYSSVWTKGKMSVVGQGNQLGIFYIDTNEWKSFPLAQNPKKKQEWTLCLTGSRLFIVGTASNPLEKKIRIFDLDKEQFEPIPAYAKSLFPKYYLETVEGGFGLSCSEDYVFLWGGTTRYYHKLPAVQTQVSEGILLNQTTETWHPLYNQLIDKFSRALQPAPE